MVTFDRVLAAGTSAIGNWFYQLGNGPEVSYIQSAAGTIAGTTVTCPMVIGGLPIAPVDTCNYNATPPDVLSKRTGLAAAAFLGFPVVKIP